MKGELYNLYSSVNIERKMFSADAIVADIHEWYGVDVDNMLTTPVAVVVNMDDNNHDPFTVIHAVTKKYEVTAKCVNKTITFKKIQKPVTV